MTPKGTVDSCVDAGEHHSPFNVEDDADRKQFAEISEGICPTCKIPAQRTDDGFARCSCCGVDWSLRGHHLLVRFDVSPFLSS